MSEAAYDPTTLRPAEDDGRSRFALDTSPGGWPAVPDTNTAAVWLNLAAGLAEKAEPFVPQPRQVKLKRLAGTVEGEYVLVERGTVETIPDLVPAVPSRIPKLRPDQRAGALLDSFLLGEPEAYGRATDGQVWRALGEWRAESRPSPGAARTASDAVAIGILARQGISAEAYDLP